MLYYEITMDTSITDDIILHSDDEIKEGVNYYTNAIYYSDVDKEYTFYYDERDGSKCERRDNTCIVDLRIG